MVDTSNPFANPYIEELSRLGMYDPLRPTVYSSPSTTITAGTTLKGSLPVINLNHKEETIYDLVSNGYWVKATGSRVTSHYTPESDWDYVVFDPELKLLKAYTDEGWTDTGSDVSERSFASLRLGDVNLILVNKEDLWKKWIIATNLIKAIDPKTKKERIQIFDSVFGRDANAEAVSF